MATYVRTCAISDVPPQAITTVSPRAASTAGLISGSKDCGRPKEIVTVVLGTFVSGPSDAEEPDEEDVEGFSVVCSKGCFFSKFAESLRAVGRSILSGLVEVMSSDVLEEV